MDTRGIPRLGVARARSEGIISKGLVVGNLPQECALDVSNTDAAAPGAIAHAFAVAFQKHTLLILVGEGAGALVAVVAKVSRLAGTQSCLEVASAMAVAGEAGSRVSGRGIGTHPQAAVLSKVWPTASAFPILLTGYPSAVHVTARVAR